MKIRSLAPVLTVSFLFVASAAMGAPEKAKQDKPKDSKDNIYANVELFADTVSIARDDYVEEVDSKKLIYGAMKGMLSSLDDYSQFMEPDEYKEIKEETKGEFGGLGIELSLKEGILTIITPIVGTPAEAAGVKPGDKIVKIDGKITKDITLSEAVKKMRGAPGTTVKLTIWRESDQKIVEIPIKRDIIKVKSVKKAKLLEGKIGYIRLIEFQEKTAKELDEGLKKLESEGMDSLILDLRNNPGGILDTAVDVSERFLAKDKLIVSTKSRTPEQNMTFKSSGKFTHPDYPIIVMVNDGSASASEIVAGAMQDNKRAVILGTKTYGKASVQTVMPLKDGSGLRLTTAYYITPSGKMIKGQGITPDVISERENAQQSKAKKDAEDIFDELEMKEGAASAKELSDKDELQKDKQLKEALNLMKAIKIYRSENK